MEAQTIFDLFRTLAHGDSTILSAIDIIEEGALPKEEARQLAYETWLAIVPTCPPGRRLSNDSIWSRGTAKFIWQCLIEPNEAKTKWLAQQIKWQRHLQRPYSIPVYHPPAPSMRKW